MKTVGSLAMLAVFSSALCAQDVIPPGTTLPATLRSTLDVRKVRPGEEVLLSLAQDVSLDSRRQLAAGTKLRGRVVEASWKAGAGSLLRLSFDRVLSSPPLAISTDLRAIASPLEVEDARVPKTGPDRGTSAASYTTVQVGGDVVYRGGGPVMHAADIVGMPVPGGVLVHLAANREGDCRGPFGSEREWQATSVFAASACGVYGYSDLRIDHAGRESPVGEISLRSQTQPIKLRAGTALLLRVTAEPKSDSAP